MKKLKIAKLIYNKLEKKDNTFFFVFTFFNINTTVIELLKTILEDNFNFLAPKVETKSKLTNFYLEFDIEDYFTEKQELFEFFNEENFKFTLSAIFIRGNFIQPFFFENNIAYQLNLVDENFIDDEEDNDNDENYNNNDLDDNDDKNNNKILEFDNFEIYTEIFFVIFLNMVFLNAYNRKIIYFINSIFIANKNLINYKCLQYIKQHQN